MTTQQPFIPLHDLRSAAAALFSCALVDLFPKAQLIDSEVTEIGFASDFVIGQSVDGSVLDTIEERMHAIGREGTEIYTSEMMRENAAELFSHQGQHLVAERLLAADDALVPVVRVGEYYHQGDATSVTSADQIGAFRLLAVTTLAAAAPRGRAITRVTGTAFATGKELKKFVKRAEAAKKRDHRRLGSDLDLFTTSDDIGAGVWVWLPKGAIIREILLDWWRCTHRKQGFLPLATPRIVKPQLLERAAFFNTPHGAALFPFFELEGAQFVNTPTSTPYHALAFTRSYHSYREFPVRYAECAERYRQVRSSQLQGLFRTRSYLVDDATTFCTPDQVVGELISSLQFIDGTIRIFGFTCQLHLSTQGDKYAGTKRSWDQATVWMRDALAKCGLSYEESTGVAFNGPRVDVRMIDALGREWSGPHVEIDFNHPERFGLQYQGIDDEMHQPIMVGRSIFGSLERFVAILVEHWAGQFPLWIAPEQVRVVPVGDRNCDYGASVARQLTSHGFRTHVDYRRETLGTKIHAAEKARVPYTVVVGDKEEQENRITVRHSPAKEPLPAMELDTFLLALEQECADKAPPGMERIGDNRSV